MSSELVTSETRGISSRTSGAELNVQERTIGDVNSLLSSPTTPIAHYEGI